MFYLFTHPRLFIALFFFLPVVQFLLFVFPRLLFYRREEKIRGV